MRRSRLTSHSAFLICDRIGRVWATRVLCILWSIGIAIFMANKGHLGAVYAGRLIAGLGIGQTTVVAPVYIAEIAPASVRGACTCFFTGAVYVGVIIAYVANYGTSRSMPNSMGRWVSLTTTWHHKTKSPLLLLLLLLLFNVSESNKSLPSLTFDSS